MNYINTYAIKEVETIDDGKIYIPSPCYLIRTITSKNRIGYQVVFKTELYINDDGIIKCYLRNFDNFDDIIDVISVDKIYDNYEDALQAAKQNNKLFNNSEVFDKSLESQNSCVECLKLVNRQG